MQIFGYYFTHVPDVVWSGVLASLLTLTGVMLSNWSNTKRLIRQLDHDSAEKAKDRIDELRRDVYLVAAEEMAKASGYLGRLPQLDPSKVNVGDGLSDFLAASARLQLVAQPETVRLAGELTTRYAEILVALLLKATPIHGLNTQLRILSDFYDRNQAEVSRVLAEMKQLNESGQPNPARFAALNESFKGSQKLAQDFAEKRNLAFQQHAIAMRDYTISLMEAIRSVGPLQVRVSAAIRAELNLAADIAEYEARMQSNWERMDASMKTILAKLEEAI